MATPQYIRNAQNNYNAKFDLVQLKFDKGTNKTIKKIIGESGSIAAYCKNSMMVMIQSDLKRIEQEREDGEETETIILYPLKDTREVIGIITGGKETAEEYCLNSIRERIVCDMDIINGRDMTIYEALEADEKQDGQDREESLCNPRTAPKTSQAYKDATSGQNVPGSANNALAEDERELLEWFREYGREDLRKCAKSHDFNATPKEMINWVLMQDADIMNAWHGGRMIELDEDETAAIRPIASMHGYDNPSDYIRDLVRSKCGLEPLQGDSENPNNEKSGNATDDGLVWDDELGCYVTASSSDELPFE